jgi:hypothetical protein
MHNTILRVRSAWLVAISYISGQYEYYRPTCVSIERGMDEPDRHTLFTEQPTVLALREHLARDRREAQPDLRECQDMTTAHIISQYTV